MTKSDAAPADIADAPVVLGPPDAMASWPTGRLLSMAARLVEHDWSAALEQLGLTHAGLIALHLLDGPPMSQTELAREARVQTQTMSRTLERLEREGYVARTPAPEDARRHVVTRTPAGAAVWERAHSLEADIFPVLEDPEGMRTSLLDIISTSSARRWQQ